jgi:hypothetical protein
MPRLFTSIQKVSVVGAGGTSLPSTGMTVQASIANNIEQASNHYNLNQLRDVNDTSGQNDSNVQSYIKIETKPLSRKCSRRCPCQCHVPFKAATPRWLQGLIGAAFVSLTGMPLLNRRSCNFRNCDNGRHRSGSVRFSYLFPTWLLRMGIEFTASWRDMSGIGGSWSLKMPQVIDDMWLYGKIAFAIEFDSIVDIQRFMATHRVRACDSFSSLQMKDLLNVSLVEEFISGPDD